MEEKAGVEMTVVASNERLEVGSLKTLQVKWSGLQGRRGERSKVKVARGWLTNTARNEKVEDEAEEKAEAEEKVGVESHVVEGTRVCHLFASRTSLVIKAVLRELFPNKSF